MQFSNYPVDHLSTGSLLKLDSLEVESRFLANCLGKSKLIRIIGRFEKSRKGDKITVSIIRFGPNYR